MIATFKERPLLCNDEMVRSILDDRKTNTRRLMKPQPLGGFVSGEFIPPGGKYDRSIWKPGPIAKFECGTEIKCPYGVPGDRLWVREAWQPVCSFDPESVGVFYRATDDVKDGKWRPSIHMPRWASRINLEITNVRVEWLQDISSEDAQAEGVNIAEALCKPGGENAAIVAFAQLWQSIYGPQSWHDNPWVWVVEFRRMEEGEQ